MSRKEENKRLEGDMREFRMQSTYMVFLYESMLVEPIILYKACMLLKRWRLQREHPG